MTTSAATCVMTYRDAINETLKAEMRRDAGVFIYGIDVDDHKAIFGSSRGLSAEFGAHRCFSTPLSEDAMTGFGLGAAINGLKPIHVHMRVDFMLLAMNQLANMLASFNFGSNGTVSVPMVIRAVIGRGWGQSWQHSKTMHACFAHIPGLKVVMPTTPEDARGILTAAIRDPNPVIVLEHRWLYDVEGDVAMGAEPIVLGEPAIRRSGTHLTIAALSWMTVEALLAADILKRVGVEVEVIDLRAAAPLNLKPVIESVQKTGHLIVADYDWIHCGLGAEVATQIYEHTMGCLKKPVSRIGFSATHCPCSRPLENVYYPYATHIIREAEKLLGLDTIDLSQDEFYSYEKKFKGPF